MLNFYHYLILKELLSYKNELMDKLNKKKKELDKKYLFNNAIDPSSAINNIYSLHLSKSACVLNQVRNESSSDQNIVDSQKNAHCCSSENITRL